jgi:GABA permease
METTRILVVANETVASNVLHESIRTLTRGRKADVLVVAPALNGRLRHWTSDEQEARRAARLRLLVCLERLRANGIDANGVVGDADPLLAIRDALVRFDAEEIVVATHPPERSHWLERDLVASACLEFDRPVVHVTVHEELERLAA